MDTQELRNLQEAYMDVYQVDEANRAETKLNLTPRQREISRNLRYKNTMSKPSRRKPDSDFYDPEKLKPRAYDNESDSWHDSMSQVRRLKRKLNTAEQADIYDIILSHLLGEGYAETPETAEAIMVNMSEEWRDSIVEKADNTIRLVYGKGGKGVPIKDGSGNVLRKPNVGFAQQGRNFRMATDAAHERASWSAGERGIRNRRNATRLQKAHKKSIQQLNAKSGEGDYDAPEGHHYDTIRSDRAARRRRETGR